MGQKNRSIISGVAFSPNFQGLGFIEIKPRNILLILGGTFFLLNIMLCMYRCRNVTSPRVEKGWIVDGQFLPNFVYNYCLGCVWYDASILAVLGGEERPWGHRPSKASSGPCSPLHLPARVESLGTKVSWWLVSSKQAQMALSMKLGYLLASRQQLRSITYSLYWWHYHTTPPSHTSIYQFMSSYIATMGA
jgi:hypothetical protein